MEKSHGLKKSIYEKRVENKGFFIVSKKNKKFFKKIWNFLKCASSDTT